MPRKNIEIKLLIFAGHIGALIPLVLIIFDYFTDNLTANPIQAITLRTGKPALVLLVLSLAVTPIHTIFKYNPIIKLRKILGLYAALYVAIHFLIFIGLDYGLNWQLIYEATFEKRFALVGFAAFLILIPLAITSTKYWMRRLGKNWKRLHRLVYLVNILAVVHYIWLVKSDIRQPMFFAGLVIFLFIIRLPSVKKSFRNFPSIRTWGAKIANLFPQKSSL